MDGKLIYHTMMDYGKVQLYRGIGAGIALTSAAAAVIDGMTIYGDEKRAAYEAVGILVGIATIFIANRMEPSGLDDVITELMPEEIEQTSSSSE